MTLLSRKCCPLVCIVLLLSSLKSSSLAFSPLHHQSTSSTIVKDTSLQLDMSSTDKNDNNNTPFLSQVLFVECGFGNDSHGQSSTKAAVRACRNAIEFNSIPSVAKLVPGGYDGLKLQVVLGVPKQYQEGLDLQQVQQVFPYGKVHFVVKDGGLVAPSGIAIDAFGDKNDDMVIVCAAVSVGY